MIKPIHKAGKGTALMDKKLLLNLTALILGIAVVGTIIWIKARHSPERLVNVRNYLHQPTPTPIKSTASSQQPSAESQSFRKATPEDLRKYLNLATEERRIIEKDMLPPVERLYQRKEEEIFRWADTAWPVHDYQERIKEFQANREYFSDRLPEEFIELDRRIAKMEELLMEGTRKFVNAPGAPMEFPPAIKAALLQLFTEIDKAIAELSKKTG